MNPVSAVLITRNEAHKLGTCLKALDWADEIVVVDSGSQDATLEVARCYTDRVISQPFENFAAQKNFAAAQASHNWILSIDADEIVTPELHDSIRRTLAGEPPHDGYHVIRRNYLFGRHLKHGGEGPEKILRLYRRDRGRFEQPIHEHVVVKGSVGVLEGELIHQSIPDLAEYFRKFHNYTDIEAAMRFERGEKAGYYQMAVLPFLRFVDRYFLKGGFLDGYEGLQFHVLSSFYCFLKYAKLRELQQGRNREQVENPVPQR